MSDESRLIQPLHDWLLLLSCCGWCTDATLTCFRQSVTYICLIASEHGPRSESKKRDQYGVMSSTSDGTWISCMPFTPLSNKIYRFPNFKVILDTYDRVPMFLCRESVHAFAFLYTFLRLMVQVQARFSVECKSALRARGGLGPSEQPLGYGVLSCVRSVRCAHHVGIHRKQSQLTSRRCREIVASTYSRPVLENICRN